MCSFSSCFRNENIAHGSKNKGLLRLFQFNKMEMIKIVPKNQEIIELRKMYKHVSDFLTSLNITHRIIINNPIETSWHCSITFDIEVWFPSMQDFVEISSCSSTDVMQAKKLQIKFNDKTTPVILNGSFLPFERLFSVWLEYNHDILNQILNETT